MKQRAHLHKGSDWKLIEEEKCFATGLSALDAQILGWYAGVTEITMCRWGAGCFGLIRQALMQANQNTQAVQLWINWPFMPNAAALIGEYDLNRWYWVQTQQPLKQAEWALKSQAVNLMVVCYEGLLDFTQYRRLQMAAVSSDCVLFLIRRLTESQIQRLSSAPINTRIHILNETQLDTRLALRVLKRKNGWPIDRLECELND